MPSPPPTVGKKNFARLVTVMIEIIPLGPVLNIGELDVTRGFIEGWYNQISIVSKFTQRISRDSGGQISSCDDEGGWSDADPCIMLAVMSSRNDC